MCGDAKTMRGKNIKEEKPVKKSIEHRMDPAVQEQYDREMKEAGYRKVRTFISEGRYAVRYVPVSYRLRVDEQED